MLKMPFGRLEIIDNPEVYVYGYVGYNEKFEAVDYMVIQVINDRKAQLFYHTTIGLKTFAEFVTERDMNAIEVLDACLNNVVKVEYKARKLFPKKKDLTKDKDFFINELRKLIQKS